MSTKAQSETTESADDARRALTSAPDASLGEAGTESPPPKVEVTRDSVKEVLVESIEIAMARKPMKVMLTILRNVDGKKVRTQKCVEIFTRDRQTAAGALKLLGQELAMFKGESARTDGAIVL